jgi:hypothetical protein
MTTPNEMTELTKSTSNRESFSDDPPKLCVFSRNWHKLTQIHDMSRPPDFAKSPPPLKSDTFWGWFWHMFCDVMFGGHLDTWNWSTFEWFLTWSAPTSWWPRDQIMSVNCHHQISCHTMSLIGLMLMIFRHDHTHQTRYFISVVSTATRKYEPVVDMWDRFSGSVMEVTHVGGQVDVQID